jgi:hypothetical protein
VQRRLLALAASSLLHVIAVATAVWAGVPAPRTTPAAAARPSSMTVFVLPREDGSAPPGLNPITRDDQDLARHTQGPSTLALPTFVVNIEKIGDRASLLFPFLTPGLSLEHFAIVPPNESREMFHDPFAPAHAQAKNTRPLPPLAMSDTALQALIDRSWSRRDRWTPFQELLKLADTHSADAGRLPDLLHAYQRQNGLQPYVDASIRDPRLWTELGLAADHVEFIGFISRFTSQHPNTKASTELLFLLDQLAQASMDALVTLIDSDPAVTLGWTRDANRGAFDLIVDLRRHYARQLERKGLTTTATLATYYSKVRLGILLGILRTTPRGYRANDARFLIGSVHWRNGDTGDALRAWRAMAREPTDTYAASIARILDAIAQTSGDRTDVDTRETMRMLTLQINSILRAEHGRWIMFSMDRLKQFGFHFDTF